MCMAGQKEEFNPYPKNWDHTLYNQLLGRRFALYEWFLDLKIV